MADYILGIDEGTTRTRAAVFDRHANLVSSSAQEIQRCFPQPGWVEQDPEEIWEVTLKVVAEALRNGRVTPEDIAAVGIANQTGTTVFWNKDTGVPVGRAIVWQDRRTVPLCEQLAAKHAADFRTRTGIGLYPNSMALRVRWLMDNDKAVRKGVARGELLCGTVESWLIWKLTGGAAHVTDLSNASATLLVNADTLSYDEWVLDELAIPRDILPQLRTSSEVYAHTDPACFFGVRVPVAGAVFDHSAALIGQACLRPGMAKSTFGTGSSLILNTGERRLQAAEGMGSSVLWASSSGAIYGLVGWMDVSGAAIQWLRDGLGIIKESREVEGLASQVPDTQGLYLVPAFYGLGAPHHDPYARGTMFGITAGTTRHHIARAALEAMAYQTRDSYEAMRRVSGAEICSLCVDGLSAQNEFLTQFLADILGIPVDRPCHPENGMLGAAALAGVAVGYWESLDEVAAYLPAPRRFEPRLSSAEREELYHGWRKAVERTARWLKE